MDYCDVFISCLDSHSDGTHSLQRIHKSVLMKKQTHLLLMSLFSANCYFLGELILISLWSELHDRTNETQKHIVYKYTYITHTVPSTNIGTLDKYEQRQL